MDNNRVSLGVIGCGKHARKAHGIALQKLPNLFSVDFLFDTNPGAIGQFTDVLTGNGSHGLEACSTADELFNKPIDAVLIATPPDSHLGYIEKAIAAKKHVFCEKPLWHSGDCSVFTGAGVFLEAKKAGLMLTSCHPRRFEPMYIYLRSHMPDLRNMLGPVVEFNFRFFYREVMDSAWRRRDDSLMLDHLNHEIDIANFVLGPSGFEMWKLSDEHDRYHCVGTRDDGTVLNFSGYRTLESKVYSHECEIVFECGSIQARSELHDGLFSGKVIGVDFELGEEDTIRTFDGLHYEDLFVPMMENFYKAIRGTAPSYVTPDELYLNTITGLELKRFGRFYWPIK